MAISAKYRVSSVFKTKTVETPSHGSLRWYNKDLNRRQAIQASFFGFSFCSIDGIPNAFPILCCDMPHRKEGRRSIEQKYEFKNEALVVDKSGMVILPIFCACRLVKCTPCPEAIRVHGVAKTRLARNFAPSADLAIAPRLYLNVCNSDALACCPRSLPGKG